MLRPLNIVTIFALAILALSGLTACGSAAMKPIAPTEFSGSNPSDLLLAMHARYALGSHKPNINEYNTGQITLLETNWAMKQVAMDNWSKKPIEKDDRKGLYYFREPVESKSGPFFTFRPAVFDFYSSTFNESIRNFCSKQGGLFRAGICDVNGDAKFAIELTAYSVDDDVSLEVQLVISLFVPRSKIPTSEIWGRVDRNFTKAQVTLSHPRPFFYKRKSVDVTVPLWRTKESLPSKDVLRRLPKPDP